MTDLEFLKDLVIIFAVALVVVAALRRIGVPTIAGFILSGVLVGPNALGFVGDLHQVELLAEIGIVLLLFGIGLELSLDRLKRLWKAVVIGGATQVVLTLGITAGIGIWLGLTAGAAIFVGCIIAVSSTAIVLRGLSGRGELEAPHGKLSLAILVFQDLCVVPMILAIPFLTGTGGSSTEVTIAALLAVGVLIGVLLLARVAVPRLLDFVARTRQRDLFVLTVFVICFGTAWMVSGAGISLALGAFLAGLVVASSEFRDQVLADVIPLREVLASVFFVSVGMLLDMKDIVEHVAPILGLLLVILVGKFLIIFFTAALMRLSLRACVLTGAALCQVGEFSFVLHKAIQGTGLIPETITHNLLVAVILSMLITPVAIALGPNLAVGVAKASWLERLLRVRTAEQCVPEKLRHHVIIAGYGITGRQLGEALKRAGRDYVVADLNAEVVQAESGRGEPLYYGDVTSPEVLKSLGLHRAERLVLAINDSRATERAIRIARHVAPDIPILARTQYTSDEHLLMRAGATEVISAETEAASKVVAAVTRTDKMNDLHPRPAG
jgi:CPA2 family monovalent cation:H+ antiporter-2